MLNQNEFLASLFNLIVETRVNRTCEGRRINDLIDSCLVDTIEYGEGKLLVSVDTLEVSDYSAQSSILTAKKPIVNEQYIETTDKKVIQVTINRYLMKGAFENEYALAECVSTIESMLEKTKNIYMYKKIVKAYEGWTPTGSDKQPRTTQTITIDLIDTDGMTGTTLVESKKANALTIYERLKALSLSVQTPSRDFNEINFEEMYNADELDFIVNGKFESLINTYAIASLLHSDKLDNIQLYDKSIIIPESQFTATDTKTKTIGWLVSKKKYQIAPRFTVNTSFNDASNLNLNEFLHFWLNSGFANGLAGVKLVANFVKPAANK